VEESPAIYAPLIAYFKSESCAVLDISENALMMQAAYSVLQAYPPKLIAYSRIIGRIMADSLLWHSGIK
jgi:hypothetical protein